MGDLTRPLSGVRLDYAVAVSLGVQIIGNENGPFAALSADGSAVCVFGGEADSVVHSSFATDHADVALQAAQSLGATLRAKNGMAECEIDGRLSLGQDYMEATLRGLVDFFAAKKIELERMPPATATSV